MTKILLQHAATSVLPFLNKSYNCDFAKSNDLETEAGFLKMLSNTIGCWGEGWDVKGNPVCAEWLNELFSETALKDAGFYTEGHVSYINNEEVYLFGTASFDYGYFDNDAAEIHALERSRIGGFIAGQSLLTLHIYGRNSVNISGAASGCLVIEVKACADMEEFEVSLENQSNIIVTIEGKKKANFALRLTDFATATVSAEGCANININAKHFSRALVKLEDSATAEINSQNCSVIGICKNDNAAYYLAPGSNAASVM